MRAAEKPSIINSTGRKRKYSGKHICVLVPTKDRPNRIEQLLLSLAEQTEPVGRIIIVASGTDIEKAVDKYAEQLPVEYYYSKVAGQIRQRNFGIQKLDDRTPLIACIDDDIVLDPWAIREMVQFWNRAPSDTGGVGFNIVNGPIERVNFLRRAFLLAHPQPGRVLKSGISTSISHLKEDIKSQWLNGGTTVWHIDILKGYKHKEINTRWAISEDLIFSYPVGKKHPLFVCAEATVQHNHDNHPKDNQWHFFHGKTQTLWLYHFVKSNKELSKILFLLTVTIRVFGKLIQGSFFKRHDSLHFSFGALKALGIISLHELNFSGNMDIREA